MSQLFEQSQEARLSSGASPQFSASSESEFASSSAADLRLNFAVRTAVDGTFFKGLTVICERSKTVNVFCTLCEPSVVSVKGSTYSTSNLITHIRRKHGELVCDSFKNYLKVKREEHVKSQQLCEGGRVSAVAINQTVFVDLIEKFVINSMIPIRVVEDRYFKDIFEALNLKHHGLRVPSRRCLVRSMKNNYDKIVEEIRASLSQVEWACTTADIWSGGKRSFFGVTVHWINQDFKRKSAAIACKRFEGAHTHSRIAEILQRIHYKFGLSLCNIVATVTDNGSNFVKAFETFGVKKQNLADVDQMLSSEHLSDEEDPELEEECETMCVTMDAILPKHLRCAAHTLALCCSADLAKTLKKKLYFQKLHMATMEKCNFLWKASRLPKSAEILEKTLSFSLRTPVETRWNSLYDSLKDILRLKPKAMEVFSALTSKHPLNDQDFEYLEELLECSTPIAQALDLLQGEENVFYGMLLPTLLSLRRKLQLLQQKEFKFCRPVVTNYLKSLETRFESIFDFDTPEGQEAAIAAMTYPRFKQMWFPCIDSLSREKLLRCFANVIRRQMIIEPSYSENLQLTKTNEESSYFEFGEPMEVDSVAEQFNDADLFMRQYFRDPGQGCDILNRYEVIRQIFFKYNTPLSSSAPVERLFSFATMTNLPKSRRLTDRHFEERVILKAKLSQEDI